MTHLHRRFSTATIVVALAISTVAFTAPTHATVGAELVPAPAQVTTSSGESVAPRAGNYASMINGALTGAASISITLKSEGLLEGTYPVASPSTGTTGMWTIGSIVGANAAYAEGSIYPPGPGNKLRIGTGGLLATFGTALKPGSTMSVYLGPTTTGSSMTLLGSAVATPAGTAAAEVMVPAGVNPGNSYRVNIVGTLASGATISNVIGAIVRGGGAMIITYPKLKVSFTPGSAKLTQSAKNALNEYLQGADRAHVLDAIVSATYAGGQKSLASKRGAKVQNYLENNGITGGVQVQLAKGSLKKSNTVIAQLSMGQ